MQVYQTKVKEFSGSSFGEVRQKAEMIYGVIRKRTKRRPYVRSRYFDKEKVFLDYFWQHLWEKNWRDRTRRLKYYACAIDLLEHSNVKPSSKENPNHKTEILHRFAGITRSGELFFVQVKEDKKTGQKSFISVFPT